MTSYDRAFLADSPRKCVRCGADVHPDDSPHLCGDIAKRHARQAKAVALITEILYSKFGPAPGCLVAEPDCALCALWYEDAALAIAKALSGRELGV